MTRTSTMSPLAPPKYVPLMRAQYGLRKPTSEKVEGAYAAEDCYVDPTKSEACFRVRDSIPLGVHGRACPPGGTRTVEAPSKVTNAGPGAAAIWWPIWRV